LRLALNSDWQLQPSAGRSENWSREGHKITLAILQTCYLGKLFCVLYVKNKCGCLSACTSIYHNNAQEPPCVNCTDRPHATCSLRQLCTDRPYATCIVLLNHMQYNVRRRIFWTCVEILASDSCILLFYMSFWLLSLLPCVSTWCTSNFFVDLSTHLSWL